jgi:Ran GTPase-activating protein (RanGAP) involved in mRNA processing and transport
MKHLKRFETFFLSPDNTPEEKDYLDEIQDIQSEEEMPNPNPDSQKEETTIIPSEEEGEEHTESKKEEPVSYEKSGLKRPDLADRNKNKKIEGWEKAIAKKIEKSIEDRKKK